MGKVYQVSNILYIIAIGCSFLALIDMFIHHGSNWPFFWVATLLLPVIGFGIEKFGLYILSDELDQGDTQVN